jgi:hypothetical protein
MLNVIKPHLLMVKPRFQRGVAVGVFPVLTPGSSHIETPLIFSDTFSKHLGADVFLTPGSRR